LLKNNQSLNQVFTENQFTTHDVKINEITPMLKDKSRPMISVP